MASLNAFTVNYPPLASRRQRRLKSHRGSEKPQKRENVIDVLLRQLDVETGGKEEHVLFHDVFEALRRVVVKVQAPYASRHAAGAS